MVSSMRFTTSEDRAASQQDIALDLGARDPSWTDAMGANAGMAWDWNVLGRAQDSMQETFAHTENYGGRNWLENEQAISDNAIPKEEWTANEYFREGIEWDERMTPVRAKLLAEDYDERRARESILARQTPAQAVAGFGVQMGVGMTDPVNFIPLVGQATKLRMIGKMGSVLGRMSASGLEAAAGNALFNPFIGADLERRGEQITMEDYVFDTVVGGGTGLLFGGAGGAWAKYFRGETKASILRASQAAADAVQGGRPVDVAPLLKDVVESGQFSRDAAMQRLTKGGLDSAQAGIFLSRLDGLAAASGMDVPTWYRKHIAEITVGGQPAEGGIRFAAAMYRSQDTDVAEFARKAIAGQGKAKKSYFELPATEAFQGKRVHMPTDTPLHIKNNHPNFNLEDLRLLPEALERVKQVTRGTSKPRYNGTPYVAVVELDGRHFGIGFEALDGDRVFVTTFFDDNETRLSNWLKEKQEAASNDTASQGKTRLSARRQPPAYPSPETGTHSQVKSSTENIHQRGEVRKALDDMQSRAKNAAPLHIVDSFEDLPTHIKAHARERGIESVTAVHDGKASYLVAENMNSVEDALNTWMHEQAMHYGLRGLVGDDAEFDRLMDGLFDYFGPDALEGIRQTYGLDFDNAAHRREAAEEMLAQIAEKMNAGAELSKMEMTAWESIRQWFREFMRSRGFEVELSDEEIATIIKDAVRWTMEGDAGVSRRGPQRFSVGGRRNGSVEFLPDGRARVQIEPDADMGEAGEALSRVLGKRFNDFPPKDRLDWRTERPERDVPDRFEEVDPEEAVDRLLARDMDEVRQLAAHGRVTEAELMELEAADRGIDQAGRISEAFQAAAQCIAQGGV